MTYIALDRCRVMTLTCANKAYNSPVSYYKQVWVQHFANLVEKVFLERNLSGCVFTSVIFFPFFYELLATHTQMKKQEQMRC